MLVISTPEQLNKEFSRLMKTYNNYYWSVAWADFNFNQSNQLVKYSNRIKKVSVGLTFYGTNVHFLKKFRNHIGVNFIISNSGTFHPKVFLFQNNINDFEILIGSANFTNSAFSTNTEFGIIINSKDSNSENVYTETFNFINSQWQKGVVINDDFINNYDSKKSKLKSTPKLPNNGKLKPLYNESWPEYIQEMNSVRTISHIMLLDWVKNEFSKQPIFHKMDLSTRKVIAGFGPPHKKVSLGCFGTTDARGNFKNKIIEKPEIISKAIACIPKFGIVTKENYQKFIKEFSKVSPDNEIACASRFLCLIRPDYFVNFNGKNEESLGKKLNIKKNKVNYNTYWDLVINPLINSDWWNDDSKKSKKNQIVFNYRVALLDCIHYDWT
jgi:hypothetical protein